MASRKYNRNVGTKGVMQLYQQIIWSKLPAPESEHKFAKPRKWAFDLAYPKEKIGIEYDGGIWTQGRHVRGAGFQKDLYKLNTAQLLGWTVLRFTPKDVKSGYALRTIEACFNGEIFLDTPDIAK